MLSLYFYHNEAAEGEKHKEIWEIGDEREREKGRSH